MTIKTFNQYLVVPRPLTVFLCDDNEHAKELKSKTDCVINSTLYGENAADLRYLRKPQPPSDAGLIAVNYDPFDYRTENTRIVWREHLYLYSRAANGLTPGVSLTKNGFTVTTLNAHQPVFTAPTLELALAVCLYNLLALGSLTIEDFNNLLDRVSIDSTFVMNIFTHLPLSVPTDLLDEIKITANLIRSERHRSLQNSPVDELTTDLSLSQLQLEGII